MVVPRANACGRGMNRQLLLLVLKLLVKCDILELVQTGACLLPQRIELDRKL